MTEQALIFLKIVLLFFVFSYAIFSIIVLNQTQTMGKLIAEVDASPIVYACAVILLLAGLALFIFGLAIL